MQEFIKITLSPTRLIQSHAPEAVGSIVFDDIAGRVSIHLFNLPEPTQFLRTPNPVATYKGWLYRPESGEILPIGTLSAGGDQLYFLYDAPMVRSEDFDEIIITAEVADHTTPEGEILLIGYLTQERSRSMVSFQPFDPPLPHHQWWKIQHTPSERTTNYPLNDFITGYQPATVLPQPDHLTHTHNPAPYSANGFSQIYHPCDFCPQRQPHQPSSALPSNSPRNGFYLPQLIGTVADESGSLQYMVHGIPGRLLRADQPDQGRTGYLYWHPYYGIEERIGAIGYWLCYIHPQTNQIATPLGVTIPPG